MAEQSTRSASFKCSSNALHCVSSLCLGLWRKQLKDSAGPLQITCPFLASVGQSEPCMSGTVETDVGLGLGRCVGSSVFCCCCFNGKERERELWFTCLFPSDMPCVSHTHSGGCCQLLLRQRLGHQILAPHLHCMTQLEPRHREGGNMAKRHAMRTGNLA